MGLKGETILSEHILLPEGILIDKMHLIDLGMFKRIMFILFNTADKEETFYLGKF